MSAKNQRAPGYAGDVSVRDVQYQNLNTNLANAPQWEMQARNINTDNQQGRLDMLEQSMPGYGNWSSARSSQAKGYASGMVDESQADYLVRKQAEQAYGGGVRGQAGDFSLLRSVGQAQYANTQYSQQMMDELNKLSGVDVAGVEDFYTSMDDALGTALSNRAARQAKMNADQAAKNIRRNAGWAALAATGQGYAQWKSGKQGSYETTDLYKDVNTASTN